jgi:hypothetical protein
MAHKCGQNTKSYQPSGDGFHPWNQGQAIADAQADFGRSVARVVGKIMRWTTRRCPGNCPLWIFGGIAIGALNQFVRWDNNLQRWHAHFDQKMTGIVLCLPLPKAKAAAKKAAKKAAEKAAKKAGKRKAKKARRRR